MRQKDESACERPTLFKTIVNTLNHLYVVDHTSYHRGFVADMLCRIRVRPPTTDLPAFLREPPPA